MSQSKNLLEIRPNRRINTIEYHAGKSQTLFFFHGFGGCALQWQQQIEFFKNDYNIIAADFLGHGDSDKPEKNASELYSFRELSLDVQALLDRFGTQQNYLIGHSYGGAFAAYTALRNPSRVDKLVLITPVILKPYPVSPLLWLPTSWLEYLRPMLNRSFLKMAFTPGTDQRILNFQTSLTEKNRAYVLKALGRGMNLIPSEDIEKLKMPILILTGYNDPLTPEDDVLAFYKPLPNANFVQIEQACHMVILEQASRVNELLKEFFVAQ